MLVCNLTPLLQNRGQSCHHVQASMKWRCSYQVDVQLPRLDLEEREGAAHGDATGAEAGILPHAREAITSAAF